MPPVDTSATPASGSASPASLEDLFAAALNDDGLLADDAEPETPAPEKGKTPRSKAPPAEEIDDEEEDEEEQDDDEEKTDDADETSDEEDTEDAEAEQDTQDDDELLDEEAGASATPAGEDILQTLVPVKVDGVEQKVTVAEALAGYSRTQDYTRKTMAVAEERKEVAAQREQYKAVLEQFDKYLGEVLVPANKPDPALRESDPGEYAAQMQEWSTLEKQRADAKAEQERLRREDAERMEAELRTFKEQEYAKVQAALPHWKDEAVAKKEARIIRSWALEQGFTDEMLAQIHFAPAILTMRKAALYDRQKTKVKEKARPVAPKKTLKSGAAKASPTDSKGATGFKKATQQLRKTGSVDAFANLLLASGTLDDIK